MEGEARVPAEGRSTLGLALAAAAGALAFLFAFHQIYDSDFWWHVAVGRWILENGRIPVVDPFSFATGGAPWVPHSWLPDVALVLVYRAWGAAGVIVLKAAIVAVGFALPVWFASRDRVHPWLAALAVAAAVPVSHFVFQERPHVVMFVLVPLFYWTLAAPGVERRSRSWAVLLGAMVAWANLHGSFLLGIALAGLVVLERLVAAGVATARRERADVRGVLLAAGLVAALCAATLVNPFGVGLPRQMLQDFTSFAMTRTSGIQEYQPILWSERPGFAALVLAAGASFVVAWRRPRVYVLLAWVAFGWMSARSVRFLGVTALVHAGILAHNLQPALARLAARVRAPAPRLQAALLVPVLVAFAAVSFRTVFVAGREARFGVGVHPGIFPDAAVRYLSQAGFQGNLFNTWELGGYVLWHLPGARDLADGRALPAHFELLDRLDAMDDAALSRWLVEHDVKGALLTRADPRGAFFAASPAYERAFFDDRAVVFLRKDVSAGAGAPVARYRFIRPESFEPDYLAPIAQGPDAPAAEAELRRAVADAPDAFQPRFLLGFFLQAQGRAECLDHYLAAARLSPGLAFAHYGLGVRAGHVALALGRAAEVEPLLRQALEVQGPHPEVQALLATSLYFQKRNRDAEALYGRALATAPDLELALTNLGYLYVDSGRAGLAVPLFQRARRVAPASENAAYGLALSLETSGDRPGAARAWREFLQAFPASAWAAKARTRLVAVEGR